MELSTYMNYKNLVIVVKASLFMVYWDYYQKISASVLKSPNNEQGIILFSVHFNFSKLFTSNYSIIGNLSIDAYDNVQAFSQLSRKIAWISFWKFSKKVLK